MNIKIEKNISFFQGFDSPEYSNRSLVIEEEEGTLSLYIYETNEKKVISALSISSDTIEFPLNLDIQWNASLVSISSNNGELASYDIITNKGTSTISSWM